MSSALVWRFVTQLPQSPGRTKAASRESLVPTPLNRRSHCTAPSYPFLVSFVPFRRRRPLEVVLSPCRFSVAAHVQFFLVWKHLGTFFLVSAPRVFNCAKTTEVTFQCPAGRTNDTIWKMLLLFSLFFFNEMDAEFQLPRLSARSQRKCFPGSCPIRLGDILALLRNEGAGWVRHVKDGAALATWVPVERWKRSKGSVGSLKTPRPICDSVPRTGLEHARTRGQKAVLAAAKPPTVDHNQEERQKQRQWQRQGTRTRA